MKKKLFIVFEQIPSLEAGGLIATYVRLVPILKKKYDVKIISAFSSKNEDNLFKDCETVILSKKEIDLKFFTLLSDLKHFHLKLFFKHLYHMFYFFLSILPIRKRMKKIVTKNDIVIATCPIAATFVPKNISYILEIHIYYEYFFGKSIFGQLQTKFMHKPALVLFRTKSDAEKAKVKFNSDYIYNFYEAKDMLPNKKLVKNKICYVGRLSEQKDPLRLIEVAKLLKIRYPNFILDIYGTGEYAVEMQQKIEEYDLRDCVFMKGFMKGKKIINEYSISWMTSKFEGLSLVMIETKASGVPLITTDWGDGVYEVIHDGVDGFVVNTNEEFVDKTIEIFENPKLQKKLSENAFQDYRRFSKKQAEERWFQILKDFEYNNKI